MKVSTAINITKKYLKRHGVSNWKIELCKSDVFIAQTDYINTRILFNKDYLPKLDYIMMRYVVLHEIAHCLTPGEEHSSVWEDKLYELARG